MLNRATQLLAQDPRLTEWGITINSVCPGWCRWAPALHPPFHIE
jgi:NAD(P)-dependent dehydrogenase (short-subunit alcohol dehydrogenase family)